MKSLLRYQIGRLPRRKVSEDETRYPQTPEGMRAFLEVFFTRHYFQVQNSLVKYLVSDEGQSILRKGHIRILDIGSGPAVASLAITDMVAHVVKHLVDSGESQKCSKVRATHVLNDTESICLGVAQIMLGNYFKTAGERRKWITPLQAFTSQVEFPANLKQLRRVGRNIGGYDLVVLSYVLTPLKEGPGLSALAAGLSDLEGLCGNQGRILILQDRFRASLIRKVAGLVGRSAGKEELTQRTDYTKNDNSVHTYSYYTCLYSPEEGKAAQKKRIA